MEAEEIRVPAANLSEQKGKFKTICVFCGSRAGYKSAFSDAALELGNFLVIDYVYNLYSSNLYQLIYTK